MAENTIAQAYVQIMPSMEGISGQLSDAFSNEVNNAAKGAEGGFTVIKGALANLAAQGLTAAANGIKNLASSVVETGKNFESSMSQVMATMGTLDGTDEELDAIARAAKSIGVEIDTTASATEQAGAVLSAFAKQQGAETAFSASQAAEALNYMALAGYDVEKSVGMLPNVLNLAAAGGIDLAYASDMVTDASSALGLSTEETTVMVDQMAKASQKSNTSVSQLGEAILKIGATARTVKGGTQELATVLGVMADNGIKGSEGGTHLRNMLLSLQAAADEGVADFDTFNVAIYDTDGNMRSMVDIITDMQAGLGGLTEEARNTAISGIFNKTDLAAVNALLATASDEFTDLYGQLDSYEVLEKEVIGLADPFSALGISATALKEALKEAGTEEEFAAQMLEEYEMTAEQASWTWEKMSDVAKTSTNRFDELSEAIGNAAGAAGEQAETQLGNLSGDLTLLSSAWEGFQLQLYDTVNGPMRSVVQTVSGKLIPALGNLVNGVDGAGEQIGEAVGEIATEIIGTVTELLPEMISMLVTFVTAVITALAENMPAIVDAIVEAIPMIVSSLLEMLPTLLGAVMEIITAIISGLAEMLPEIVQKVVDIIPVLIDELLAHLPEMLDAAITLLMAIVDAIPTIITSLLDNLPHIIETILNGVLDALPELLDAAITLFMALIDALPTIIDSLIENLPKIIDTIITTLLDHLPDILDGAIQLLMAIVSAIPTIIDTLVIKLPEIVTTIVDTLIDHLPELIEGAFQLFMGLVKAIPKIILELIKEVPQIITTIVTSLKNGLSKIKDVGWNLLQGLWEGISSAAGWLWDKISGWASGLLNSIKGIFGIHSPSKVFAGFGEMLSAGLGEGIEDGAHYALDAVTDMSNGIMDAITGTDLTIVPQLAATASAGRYRNGYGTAPGWHTAGTSNNIVMNIYGAEGQDIRALADIVIEELTRTVYREAEIYA